VCADSISDVGWYRDSFYKKQLGPQPLHELHDAGFFFRIVQDSLNSLVLVVVIVFLNFPNRYKHNRYLLWPCMTQAFGVCSLSGMPGWEVAEALAGARYEPRAIFGVQGYLSTIMTLSPVTINQPPVYGQPPLFGQVLLRQTQPMDGFEPQFAGKRLQAARRKSTHLMLLGLLLGGGTTAYAAVDSIDTTPRYSPHGPSLTHTQILEGNLWRIAEDARQTAHALVPPASGRTAPDAMLRQTFCDYVTGISREIASYNNDSRKFLQPDNIASCFPEVVFDRTAFSDLMWEVYEGDGWHSIEQNYDRALDIIFGEDANRLSEQDKHVLLDEAETAFNALRESDEERGNSPGTHSKDESLPDKTLDRIRKSTVMLALLAASGAMLGIGLVGRVGFGVAEGADKRIQRGRAKRRVKKLKP